MDTWTDMASDARRAAEADFDGGRYRACANRAYYAAYSVLTQALRNVPVDLSYGGNNPKHKRLPELVERCLTTIRDNDGRQARNTAAHERANTRDILQRLYAIRLDADYYPAAQVDRKIALTALYYMAMIFDFVSIRTSSRKGNEK